MDFFDLFFSAMMVFQAGSMFMIGFVFTAIGGLLVVVDMRSHYLGKKVGGKIIGIQISERPKGNLYFPVYRFKNIEGEIIEKTSDEASNMVLNNLPGLSHRLLLMPGDRENFRKNSYAFGIFGLVFLFPGLFILQQAFLLVELTPTFVILSVVFIGYIFYKPFRGMYKFLHTGGWHKIKEEFHKVSTSRKPFLVFSSAEKKDLEDGFTSRLMEPSEIRARIPKERRQSTITIVILLAVAGSFLFFANKSANNIIDLEAHGITAKGNITGFKESHGDDSSTYTALFEFKGEDGITINAKDSFGYSHPTLKRGQEIDVLYDPRNPQETAIIDRGIWNWFFSALLALGGVLSLFLAYKLVCFIRNSSRFYP